MSIQPLTSRPPTTTLVDDLPEELLLFIFSKLDNPSDLLMCRLTTRRWKRIAEDPLLGTLGCLHRRFTGAEITSQSLSSPITCMKVFDTNLVSAHLDGHIRHWTEESTTEIYIQNNHITELALERGWLMAASPAPGRLHVFNLHPGTLIRTIDYDSIKLRKGRPWGLSALQTYNPMTNVYARRSKTAPHKLVLATIEGINFKHFKTLLLEKTNPITYIAAHHAYIFTASGTTHFTIHMWDSTGELTHTFTLKSPKPSVTALAFHDHYMFSGHQDGAMRIWDLMEKTRVSTKTLTNDPITALTFDPHATTLYMSADTTLFALNFKDA